ncbi:MAG: HepT-like ribonuclease domain-containing protein [bacterium]
MLNYSREALDAVRNISRKELDSNRLLNLALVRLLEIIGEAANRVSSEKRSEHPGIPWGEIVSLRNRLIHGYDQVDFDILWQIVKNDIPALITALEPILSPSSSD